MLVQDAVNLCEQVIKEFNNSNIMTLLQETVPVLQFRGTANEHAYPNHAKNIRNKAAQIIRERSGILASPEMVSFIERAKLEIVAPVQLAWRVHALCPENINNAGVSSEAAALIVQAQQALAVFQNFKSFANALGMGSITFEPDRLSLRTLLPESLFERDIGHLGQILEKMSDFFGDVTEFASGSRHSPKLEYASTSIFQIWQSIQSDQIVHVMSALKACFDAAKSALDLRKSVEAMKNLGTTEEEIKPIKDRRENINEQKLEDQLLRSLLGSKELPEIGRQRELSQHMVSSARYFARQIENGLEVTVERRSETTTTMQMTVNGQDGQVSLSQIIREVTIEQKAVTDARNNAVTPLLTKLP